MTDVSGQGTPTPHHDRAAKAREALARRRKEQGLTDKEKAALEAGRKVGRQRRQRDEAITQGGEIPPVPDGATAPKPNRVRHTAYPAKKPPRQTKDQTANSPRQTEPGTDPTVPPQTGETPPQTTQMSSVEASAPRRGFLSQAGKFLKEGVGIVSD